MKTTVLFAHALCAAAICFGLIMRVKFLPGAEPLIFYGTLAYLCFCIPLLLFFTRFNKEELNRGTIALLMVPAFFAAVQHPLASYMAFKGKNNPYFFMASQFSMEYEESERVNEYLRKQILGSAVNGCKQIDTLKINEITRLTDKMQEDLWDHKQVFMAQTGGYNAHGQLKGADNTDYPEYIFLNAKRGEENRAKRLKMQLENYVYYMNDISPNLNSPKLAEFPRGEHGLVYTNPNDLENTTYSYGYMVYNNASGIAVYAHLLHLQAEISQIEQRALMYQMIKTE